MQAALRVVTRTWVLLVALVIAGCPAPGVKPGTDAASLEARARQLEQSGDHAAAAEAYEKLASRASEQKRNEYLLEAAELWLLAGETDAAERAVRGVRGDRSTAQVLASSMLAARISIAAGEPERALEILQRLPADMPSDLRPAVLELQASALFRIGDPVTGIGLLIERGLLLTDPVELAANERKIFNGMQQTAAANFDLSTPLGADPIVDGWLALGRAAAAAGRNPFSLEAKFLDWRLAYPWHPANDTLVDEILQTFGALMQYPRRVALLLPLSGRSTQSAAAAVRDGFLAAYFQHGRDAGRPEVVIYDTSDTDVLAVYERAVAEGSEFIVGPLTKTAVSDVALSAQTTTGTLALNYLPDEQPVPELFYQFALAPEDEAGQVAERAIGDGYTRGLMLVPNSQWGRRIHASFAARFDELGGTLLDFRFYDASPGARDFSVPITMLLQHDQSQARRSKLASVLGTRLEFVPRIRADAQFIFLAGQPAQGRAIRPQLRYFYAENLPVYSTSAVYEPSNEEGADPLNQLIFNEVPWLVAPDAATLEIRETIARHWPARAVRRSRLYAMGFDAYRLVPVLQNQPSTLENPIPGMTGALSMDLDGRIHRRLEWAQMRFGEPQLLSGQSASGADGAPAAVVGAPGDSPDLLPPEGP